MKILPVSETESVIIDGMGFETVNLCDTTTGFNLLSKGPADGGGVPFMRFRLRTLMIWSGVFGLGLPLLLTFFSTRGARIQFSPDTLESRGQYERLLWASDVPVFRRQPKYFHHDLVKYLITEEYWRAENPQNPRWLLISHWNDRWRDGQSMLHWQLVRNGDMWIQWTKENPQSAEVVWPLVLDVLRDDVPPSQAGYTAARLLYWVESSADESELRDRLKHDTEIKSNTINQYLSSPLRF